MLSYLSIYVCSPIFLIRLGSKHFEGISHAYLNLLMTIRIVFLYI